MFTLSKQQISDARKALNTLSEALAEIERAEAAGVDQSDGKALHDFLRDNLSKIVQEYGQQVPQS